ncbi:MAG: hypothetical protein ACYCYF_10045, partial [Anaerolineae bacterium]
MLRHQHRVYPFRRTLLALLVMYLATGALFSLGTLACYNLRNWDLMGGFGLPPLYVMGLPADLLAWPVFLRANLVNGLGLLWRCSPLWLCGNGSLPVCNLIIGRGTSCEPSWNMLALFSVRLLANSGGAWMSQDASPDRLLLTGVPRVEFFAGGPRCPEDITFASCLRAALE